MKPWWSTPSALFTFGGIHAIEIFPFLMDCLAQSSFSPTTLATRQSWNKRNSVALAPLPLVEFKAIFKPGFGNRQTTKMLTLWASLVFVWFMDTHTHSTNVDFFLMLACAWFWPRDETHLNCFDVASIFSSTNHFRRLPTKSSQTCSRQVKTLPCAFCQNPETLLCIRAYLLHVAT